MCLSAPAIADDSATGAPPPYPVLAVVSKKATAKPASKPYPDWAVRPYDPGHSKPEVKKTASRPYPDWAVLPYDPHRANPAQAAPEKSVAGIDMAPADENDSRALKVTIPNIRAMRPASQAGMMRMAGSVGGNGQGIPPAAPPASDARGQDLTVPPIHDPVDPDNQQDSRKDDHRQSVVIYQSPPPIIKKQVVHEIAAGTSEKPASIIPSLTPQQLAALAPAAGPPPPPPPPPAGDDTSAATAPLLPIPDQPAPPSPLSNNPPARPPAALSDIKPLLPLPSAPPPAQAASPSPSAPAPAPAAPALPSSLDTLLRDVSGSPQPAIAKQEANASAAKKEGIAGATIPQDNSEPEPLLSSQSKKIIHRIPSSLGRGKAPSGPITIEHAKNMDDLGSAEPKVKTVKEAGLNISIGNKSPKIDPTYQLQQAYEALNDGQTSEAVGIYKNILSNDPRNQNALFGLAALYQRAGQIDLARPLYAKLLSINPKDRDGLNNFLALLAEEAPEDALKQMENLEVRNPQFSPIPAQMGVIYARLGNLNKASEKMFRAVELEPENLTYQYNLAIILDKQGKYDEAARLYRTIVSAWQRGAMTPGNIDKIQQRLTFISSNRG